MPTKNPEDSRNKIAYKWKKNEHKNKIINIINSTTIYFSSQGAEEATTIIDKENPGLKVNVIKSWNDCIALQHHISCQGTGNLLEVGQWDAYLWHDALWPEDTIFEVFTPGKSSLWSQGRLVCSR